MNINDEAVDAAAEFLPLTFSSSPTGRAQLRAALEAAAPHMLNDISKARKGDLFRFTWAQRAWLRHNPYRITR